MQLELDTQIYQEGGGWGGWERFQSNDFSCSTTGNDILRIGGSGAGRGGAGQLCFSGFLVSHWRWGKIERVFGSRDEYSCPSVFPATQERLPVKKAQTWLLRVSCLETEGFNSMMSLTLPSLKFEVISWDVKHFEVRTKQLNTNLLGQRSSRIEDYLSLYFTNHVLRSYRSQKIQVFP